MIRALAQILLLIVSWGLTFFLLALGLWLLSHIGG
jgi:hypothetical protein